MRIFIRLNPKSGDKGIEKSLHAYHASHLKKASTKGLSKSGHRMNRKIKKEKLNDSPKGCRGCGRKERMESEWTITDKTVFHIHLL